MKKAWKIAGFWLRLVAFALVLVITLNYTVYVLTPKYDYGICPISNYYKQPENSIDVLVLGTSCGYAGVNTNVLWEEYGLAVYNLCCAEQPYWVTYYYLVEALKTQQPKLILLDLKASIYTDDYSKRGRTILSTYGIRDPKVRLEAIAACVAEEDYLGFALAFPELHSYYAKVEKENFIYPPTNAGRGPDWKGFIENTKHSEHEPPSVVWSNTQKKINDREMEYFEKTLALANEYEIPVLLVGFPLPDYAHDHQYYNTMYAKGKEYGAAGVNYNDPYLQIGLLYSKHFADWQHLNVEGSVIFSRYLGNDLRTMFDLPDRRGEETYETWQRCADDWYEKYPQYRPETEVKQ